MNQIRILIVDDQPLFRDGLATLLGTIDDLEVVATAENGADALRLAALHHPAVVLMDLRMPVMDGVAATRRLRAEVPSAQVVVLTTFDDDESIIEAVRAGALGYLLKDTSSEELANAVRRAAKGESILTPRVATRLMLHVAHQSAAPAAAPNTRVLAELTAREREILTLLGRGSSNKDIARQLNVTEGTVKNHVSSIFAKLNVNDRLGAALLARELGLA